MSILKRACATAVLSAAALLPTGEAHALWFSMFDVTEAYEELSVGTAPTQSAVFSQSLLSVRTHIPIRFVEGDLLTFELDIGALLSKPNIDIRIELRGSGAGAYKLSVGALDAEGRPTIPPEPSLSALTLTLARAGATGDMLSIRALRDDNTSNPPPATLKISHVSGDSVPNLPEEFMLLTSDPAVVNVKTYRRRGDVASAALTLSEDNDAVGFMRFYLTKPGGDAAYVDSAGGVGTLTLTFESPGRGDEVSLLCPDDLGDLETRRVDICVRPVADASYKLNADDADLHLTYQRNGRSQFWLEIAAPEDIIYDQTTRVNFSLSGISVGDDAWMTGAHEGAITVVDTSKVLRELRVEGDEDFAHAATVIATLRLSGFDQHGAAVAIRAIEVSATATAGAQFTSIETIYSDDGATATLTLTIGSVSGAGARGTIILRAGEAYGVEVIERRTIEIAATPYVYAFRDITALNPDAMVGEAVNEGSAPPLDPGREILMPADGEILLEFYVAESSPGERGDLYLAMDFIGAASAGYKVAFADGLSFPPAPADASLDNLVISGASRPDRKRVIRIRAPSAAAAAAFRMRALPHAPGDANLRSAWPPSNLPLTQALRAVGAGELPDVAAYPASAADGTELVADADRTLSTASAAQAPASIAVFAVADGGADAFAAKLKNLRLPLRPENIAAADLEATLRAFTFVLRDASAPGLTAAPASARINQRLRLIDDEGALRLQMTFAAPTAGAGATTSRIVIPNGETAYYEILAYHSDASARVDARARFRVHLAADSFDFRGGSGVSRLNTTESFVVDIEAPATEFRVDGVESEGFADVYRISGAAYPILRVNGAFTDAFGNVDTSVAERDAADIGAFGVLRRVGTDATLVVTPTAVAVGHVDFDAGGLAAFIAELERLGGGADSADGSRWALTMNYQGAPGDARAFVVDVVGGSSSLQVTDLRLVQKFEHDTTSFVTFSARHGDRDISLDDRNINVGAVCAPAARCETVEARRVRIWDRFVFVRGFWLTPVLGADYSVKYGTSLRLTFRYNEPTASPLPAVHRLTLGAEGLSAGSPIQDFEVLPIPMEVFFEQREYRVGENVVNADLGILGRPAAGRRNTPGSIQGTTLPTFRARLEFGEAMTGYADWPASISPAAAFAELDFNSVTTQLLYPVPVIDDTTYKPRETMEISIVSVRFTDDDSPARYNFGSGHERATIVVADNDTVDVNAELYANRNDDDPRAALEFFEANATAAYLRLYMTEADGGADYHDAAGGAGTITLTFSGESALCPSSLGALSGLPVDLCMRPVRNANYTLAGDSTGTVHLNYMRDGEHEFWLELVAPADGVDESTPTITFDISAISVGGDPFQKGTVAGSVTIFDLTAGSAVPFVLDYDQSGNVNISDGLILGRLMAGIIAFETNFSSILNRFFAENAPPGTLVADSMLLDLISEEATADAERLLSDRTLRDEALQSVLFIYFNYSDDLDLDKSGNLNISDGLILGRLVAGVIAAEVSFGPGFPNFFNPDGSLNKGLDPGTLDLFYVDVEADATGILPNEAVRREAIEKVLEIYVRAGFSFTD